jgi:hypothetical protein
VVQTRGFGHFSGQKPADADTTKWRSDTKHRCGRGHGGAQADRYENRREKTRDDREWTQGRNVAAPSYAGERTRVKENRSARPTRIGEFAKGARRENQKSDDFGRRSRQG